MQDAHDLKLIFDAGIPLVVINSFDEPRVMQLLHRIARKMDRPLFQWTVTDGLRRATFGLQIELSSEQTDPEKFLEHLKHRAETGIYAICDFHPWLEDSPKLLRLIKDIALKNEHGAITLVFISHELKLPADLQRLSAKFSLKLPDEDKIKGIVRDEARKWSKRNGNKKVMTNSEAHNRLVANLAGLSEGEIGRMVRTAIVDDGAITEEDLPGLNRAKFQLMDLEGVLSYEYQVGDFAHVGGMENLQKWLEKRRHALDSNESADMPKGILLLGVQGGGKSLAARAVAGGWSKPLLRLDMGALYNKYYGETEKNLRQSLQLADRMAPCVLWIDEIEKGLASDDNDGGLSQRVLGSLLTWMAERKSRVFLVATSNDISRLPPELLRKGRMDEMFFVDLPGVEAREKILHIHLQKRQLDPDTFDINQLIDVTEGFTGAEIEQAIVSAVYSGLADKTSVTQQLLLEEIESTTPLSVIKAEQIAGLKRWAKERKLPTV